MGPMIKTNILHCIGLYIEIVEPIILFDEIVRYLIKDCTVLIVDSLKEKLKVGPPYTHTSPAQESFPRPTNNSITVRPDTWVQLAS